MTQVWEYIKIALMNIRSNKGRSILTMLGIIIGISSVIMIISIGNGVKSGINGELNSMAGGQIAVYSSNTAENGTEVVFTEEDMDAILEKVKDMYKDEEVNDIDGVKIDFPDKWVHLRKSNTEPIIRVYSEAATQAEAEEIGRKVMDVVYSLV